MNLLRLPLLAAASLGLAASAQAVDFDFSGTFTKDNDVVSLLFTVGSESNVTIFSSSWDEGGFDPILAIWNSSGDRMSQQDDGLNIGSTVSNGVSYTHGYWDSYYSVLLAPGTYRATIAQYDNFSVSTALADGFRYDGEAHFTFTRGYGIAPDFNGVAGTGTRTGDWAFHILNVDQATQHVPDATSSIGLSLLGLASLLGCRRAFRG